MDSAAVFHWTRSCRGWHHNVDCFVALVGKGSSGAVLTFSDYALILVFNSRMGTESRRLPFAFGVGRTVSDKRCGSAQGGNIVFRRSLGLVNALPGLERF